MKSAYEDCIECNFFSITEPDKIYLEKSCSAINYIIKLHSNDYIWHRDEFKLNSFDIVINSPDGSPPHIKSNVNFGDNIEDEWFIVHLIFEITKVCNELIVQLKDNDGDFLLIEAAEYLPTWVTPENTTNRVFIYQNEIHIIPLSLRNDDTELTVKEAINLIGQCKEETKASPEILNQIFNRIGNYPQKIKDNMHITKVQLPINIAALLNVKPTLIAPIVNAYCNHDMIDIKKCKNIDYDKLVTVPVKFTKCLYAMLLHSKTIFRPSHNLNKLDKKTSLGLKLMYGFHMVVGKLSEDIFSTKDFRKYLQNLQNTGYFRGNIERSKEYNKLLDTAKEYYLNTECPVNSYACHNILEVMQSNEFSHIKDTLNKNPDNEADVSEDSDDWLNVSPEELDNLLHNKYGKKDNVKVSEDTIPTKLNNFFKQSSEFDGIEFSDMIDSDESDNEPIKFDSNEFMDSIQKMLQVLSSNNQVENEFDEMEQEIIENLKDKVTLKNDKSVHFNIVQSMKEERGSSGPSSNILKTLGVNKTDLLDSDDDE